MRLALVPCVLALACTKPPVVPPATVPPSQLSNLECPLTGVFALWPSARLFVGDGKAARLRFRGSAVSVEARVSAAQRVPVVVRTSPDKPSLRFPGFLERRELPIKSARAIPIVPDHVWIVPGVPLELARGELGIRVESTYREGLADLGTDVRCDALALNPKSAHEGPYAGAPHHLAGKTFALLDAPGGNVLRELRPTAPELFTLWVAGTDGGFAHVVNHDWVSIDGWVNKSELVAGEAGDCDDCRGAIMDVDDLCLQDLPAGGPDDGCPDHDAKAMRVIRAVDVTDPAGGVIGSAEEHAKVWVTEQKNGRAHVFPRPPVVLPEDRGWWLASDALAADD